MKEHLARVKKYMNIEDAIVARRKLDQIECHDWKEEMKCGFC